MEKINFTHLHVHSGYSLLDATSKMEDLIATTKKLGMDSIAITDHGVMYGVIDFYKEARKQGIKPILGCEVYVSSGDRKNKEYGSDNFYYHLVLLAENNTGYENLMKMCSIGFTEGFYYKPRIDVETMRKYSEGVIALSACLSGVVTKPLLRVSYAKALEQAILYREIFGENNFFLEIQDHNIADERRANVDLIKIHKETGIPIVCTNDTHYINKEDSYAHEVFLCVQTGKTMNDDDRMKYGTDQLYLKSPEEMYELFSYIPESLENTYKIAQRCNVEIEFHNYKLRKYEIESKQDPYLYLKNLCEEGLKARYENITQELKDRLQMELDVINNMGFIDYFLIVWDFIKYAKDNGIVVGPGRGSAAGSIVAYALRITDIDPIKYNLIFERFLNSERISMPDIDIDFCYERRQEVIDYVISKYGKDYVAQIITFGTLAARNAIRDTGRALDIAYSKVDLIAKMIPQELGITIKKALEMNPELAEFYNADPEVKELIDLSEALEGLPRHASTHAAGIVICDKPVYNYVPLYYNDGAITTQFSMTTLEELGLLKMDFLGLRTLTVINNCLEEVKRIHNKTIDFSRMDYDDKKVFELIGSGKTDGVFQLESSGMKSFMRELLPESLEDVIAGISLYRPGPMDFIPKYIKGKNNINEIKYLHESLIPILEPTYGCIVYQEQVMDIVRQLAGYSLGRSDLVRRAMSKKSYETMQKERKNFIHGIEEDGVAGCVKNGINEEIASQIFDEMTDFAKYAFNKSHAAAYAVIAYQTAYLKYYYPVEFMAALITSVMDASITKVASYIEECKKMNIDLLAPDINESYSHFSVNNKAIRFGLAAIKGVGRPTIKGIIKEREAGGKFSSLTEFINRMDGGELNKRCLENLIRGGAFDSLGGFRKQYSEIYKNLLDGVSQTRKKNIEGQLDLFSFFAEDVTEVYKDIFKTNDEYSKKELLEMEKEVLGIYISGHPLEEYFEILKKHTSISSLDLLNENSESGESETTEIYDGEKVKIGGIIAHKSVKYTKNNKAMAFLTVEDVTGSFEVIVFPNVYDKYLGKLNEGKVIIIDGVVSSREEEDKKIILNSLKTIEEINASAQTLWLKILSDSNVSMSEIINVLKDNRGNTPVIIVEDASKKKTSLGDEHWVNISDELINNLKNLLGSGSVVIVNK